jgi:hypothetical protein
MTREEVARALIQRWYPARTDTEKWFEGFATGDRTNLGNIYWLAIERAFADADCILALAPSHEAGTQHSCPCGVGDEPCPGLDGEPLCAKAGTQEPVTWRWRKDTGEILSEWIDNASLDYRKAKPREFLLQGKIIRDGFYIEKAYAAPAHDAARARTIEECAKVAEAYGWNVSEHRTEAGLKIAKAIRALASVPADDGAKS